MELEPSVWSQFLSVLNCADCGVSHVGEIWEKTDINGKLCELAVDPCSMHHQMFLEQGWSLRVPEASTTQQEDTPLSALEGLFRYADIDELSEDDHGNGTYLAFTLRHNHRRFSVEGEALEDALAMAEEITRRDLTLENLRREGLTDEDIDRLAVDTGELVEEAWQRGFAAAMQELDRLDHEVAAAEAYAEWADGIRPFTQAPAAAMAAEPLTGTVVTDEVLEPISASIFAEDVAERIDPDKVGIPVILQVPARIVLS